MYPHCVCRQMVMTTGTLTSSREPIPTKKIGFQATSIEMIGEVLEEAETDGLEVGDVAEVAEVLQSMFAIHPWMNLESMWTQ
jgi:hypothetical protein